MRQKPPSSAGSSSCARQGRASPQHCQAPQRHRGPLPPARAGRTHAAGRPPRSARSSTARSTRARSGGPSTCGVAPPHGRLIYYGCSAYHVRGMTRRARPSTGKPRPPTTSPPPPDSGPRSWNCSSCMRSRGRSPGPGPSATPGGTTGFPTPTSGARLDPAQGRPAHHPGRAKHPRRVSPGSRAPHLTSRCRASCAPNRVAQRAWQRQVPQGTTWLEKAVNSNLK